MARTIRTKVYKFNELTKDAQEKAIDSFRDINTDYEWHEYVYEDFKEICQLLGIDVDLDKTYFQGFSCQGDGAAFTADIDLFKLIEGIKEEKWKEHAPLLKQEVRSFDLSNCNVDARVLNLIKNGLIDLNISVVANSRYYRSKLEFYYNHSYNECINYNNIEREMAKLEDWLQDSIDELTNLLYRLLEKEYEYQTSDEAVKESIISNGYEFTKDGKQF